MNAENTANFNLDNKYKILVVDDDSDSRYMLRFLLEKEQHQVFEAIDGKQGLKIFSEIKPDIVITDIVMPEKDGISLIKELREINHTLPVIAITSDIHGRANEFFQLSKQVGATTVLEKPIAHDNLATALFESIQGIE
jgi:CheY-like chemotaxis protein